MELLLKTYSALQGPQGQPQSGPETIDRLCDRAQSSTLIEDRRAAVLSLKALARDYQLEVGTRGMPILINVLNEDRSDVEILRAALETLNTVCTVQKENPDEQDLGVMFTEIFVKTSANVSLLLGLLEIYDFYVRYHTVTLLTLLLENRPKQLQACILESPLGISRLIDLLDDTREIIRNEGLLLLISLTKANTDIQKIVAFENAFERLLGVIYEEGLIDGGIIVSDCLHLVLNLLRGNVSNQNYFRETGGLSRLPQLFNLNRTDGVPLTWTEQKQNNLSLVMDLVRLFVAHRSLKTASSLNSSSATIPSNGVANNGIGMAASSSSTKSGSTTATGQAVFVQNGILQAVTELALAQDIPLRIKQEALLVVADIIRGLPSAQDSFAKSVSKPPSNPVQGTPLAAQDAVSHIISLAVTSSAPWNLRAAAAHTLKCYMYKRPDVQIVLISALASMPPSIKGTDGSTLDTPGVHLFRSLVEWEASRKDPYQVWMASLLVSAIVKGEPKCKDRLLEIHIPIEGDDNSLTFLAQLSQTLQSATDNHADGRVVVAYLSLLATLFYHYPKAVRAFLQEGSNLQFLLEQVSRSTGVDATIQSLAAFLLGLVIQFNDSAEQGLRRVDLQEIIVSRIGEDQFVQRLQALREADSLRQDMCIDLSMSFKFAESKLIPTQLFDYEFAQFVLSSLDEVERAVLAPVQNNSVNQDSNPSQLDPTTADVVVESYKSIIRQQDMKIAQLTQELTTSKTEVSSLLAQLAVERSKSSQLEESKSKQETMNISVRSLKEENDDLRLQVQRLQSESLTQVKPLSSVTSQTQQESELKQQQQKYDDLEKEHNDLLVLLAEMHQSQSKLKERLRSLGQEVSDDDGDGDEEEDEEVV